MKKIAYLTMADAGDFVTDYHMSIEPMAALGWQVETVAWRSQVDWTEGEYSLFFFNGVYSHAILKTPKPGDFRVQEEHGAGIKPVQPSDALLQTATSLFGLIEPQPTYGRGDWVRDVNGRYLLMELELIEPSLYLRTDGGAARRFALALDQRFQVFAGERTAG